MTPTVVIYTYEGTYKKINKCQCVVVMRMPRHAVLFSSTSEQHQAPCRQVADAVQAE